MSILFKVRFFLALSQLFQYNTFSCANYIRMLIVNRQLLRNTEMAYYFANCCKMVPQSEHRTKRETL